MGTLFEIVAPKPVRAWNNISWLAHPPVAPEQVHWEVFIEPESPVVHDVPLYYLPNFSVAAIYATSRAESTTVNDTASVSPSSYLSALAVSIPPLRVNDPHSTVHGTKAIRPRRQGSREYKLFQFLRVRPFSYLAPAVEMLICVVQMSYDQKVAEIERLIRWMRSHSQ
ncbi:hypothetical protein DEU56DRAFT_786080, partial [Suillus clintonianus]|uniref:uncharacterized protein n=1 Tax=Suillus clintonianus TaxID=1904413 RepID=UPI001B86A312